MKLNFMAVSLIILASPYIYADHTMSPGAMGTRDGAGGQRLLVSCWSNAADANSNNTGLEFLEIYTTDAGPIVAELTSPSFENASLYLRENVEIENVWDARDVIAKFQSPSGSEFSLDLLILNSLSGSVNNALIDVSLKDGTSVYSNQKVFCYSAAQADSQSYSVGDLKNACLAISYKTMGYCPSILDKDLQNTCVGGAVQNPSFCQDIQDSDLKNACLGSSYGSGGGYCASIKDPNLKNLCMGGAHGMPGFCDDISDSLAH